MPEKIIVAEKLKPFLPLMIELLPGMQVMEQFLYRDTPHSLILPFTTLHKALIATGKL